MDAGDKDKPEVEKGSTHNSINYNRSSISPDWQFGAPNLASSSIRVVPTDNQMTVCSTSSIAARMMSSFGQNLWDSNPNSAQNVEICPFNVQNHASISGSSTMGNNRPDIAWNPLSSFPRGMFSQNLAQFPADTGFIERAARFSCFSGNFSDMVNSYGVNDPMGFMMQGPPGLCTNSESIPPGSHEPPKDSSLSVEHSPLKSDVKSEGHTRPPKEESKRNVPGSSDGSDDAGFSVGNDPSLVEGACREPLAKSLVTKKRKRIGQDSDAEESKRGEKLGEATKCDTENKHKDDQSPTTNASNPTNGKQGSQASDPPKEGYIHVRARRGQATNSHSLAERVRREKISERMKFLQDLVPGCNKVTGKAVMLDEIINYVQSLQRQVEFLSMKLATVNPQLDLNLEGVLAKDVLHSRPGPSCASGFHSDIPVPYPPLHSSQLGIMQPPGLSGVINSNEVLRRTINSQLPPINGALPGGFKHQEPHVWDDELHNIVHMSYRSSPEIQDSTDRQQAGNMKAEL